MSDFPVKEIGELMDMMTSKLPSLLRDVQQVLFSEEGAKTMGTAVGIFYKNLIEAGMEQSDALRLTEEYMSTLKSLTNQFKGS